MASFHSRSNSFPSQPHPVVNDVEDHLCRIKASQEASTSASSICSNLASLRDLHDGINNMIQKSSVQQALSLEQGEDWINELLEGSLRLVDLCGFSREVVCLTKESVQELESSIRRKADGISAYVASRKNTNKMVNKCIKNLKSFNKNSAQLPEKEGDLKTIGTMLKETEALDFSVLKSVLIVLFGAKESSKQRSWSSLLSKFGQTSRVHCEMEQQSGDLCALNFHTSKKGMSNVNLKQLKATEKFIEEIEEGLEAYFRSLIKTRVSLLNVLCH